MAQLLRAAGNGDVEKVLELRDQWSHQNKKGETVLHTAVSEDQLSVVTALVSHGVMLNIQDKKNKFTPLMLCLAQQPTQYLEIMQAILKGKPDLSVQDSAGQTVLHLAAQYEEAEAVEMILKAKPKVDATDAKKMTALHIAAAKGDLEIIKLLVERGHASVNSTDAKGNTPLHWVLINNAADDVVETVEYLVSKGAKCVKNAAGSTPFHSEALHWQVDEVNANGLTAQQVFEQGIDAEEEEAPAPVDEKQNSGPTKRKTKMEVNQENQDNAAAARAAAIARTKKKAAKSDNGYTGAIVNNCNKMDAVRALLENTLYLFLVDISLGNQRPFHPIEAPVILLGVAMADEELDLFSAFDANETLTAEEKQTTASAAATDGTDGDDNSSLGKRKDAPDGVQSAEPPSKKHTVATTKTSSSIDVKIVEGKHIDPTPVDANGSAGEQRHVATGTTQKNMISFSVYPPDYVAKKDDGPKPPPAKTYPFTLDPFQQQSVDYIEAGESVLVSAHTSAGKTAVAEYAIAKSLRDKQRVIYTSPIKALSNQKYRDLEEEFGDVGLMTGDITINPSATCLIMTTEILRSMLYRGSEVMREVAWVIYDEIHYMRDKERGVVWEESIILLPHKVRFVFLSATIPNSKEFAAWICHIHHQPCHVVYTDYRPTPLQHYVFPAGGSGLHLVVDEKGKFREDNFQKAIATLTASAEPEASTEVYGSNSKRKKAKGGANPKKKIGSDVYRIVKLIMERQYDPVIVFSFSKRECESYALLMSKLDFNTEEEKQMVEQVFKNAMDSLSDDDKTLPQVDSILPLLRRGIGIHHGGLLPILKEVIEIMFAEGLLKCLFATETFSMGLNMPAKTVVFTNCRKYDGKDFRWITSGEYIQMSGRAGRRSLDNRGIVIQMLSEQMEPQVAKGILYGQADPLFSSFHLGYNMLLNLLRVEDADPEYMIKQSFHQFQNEQAAPALEDALARTREERDQITIKNEEEVAEYYFLSKSLIKLKEEFLAIRNKPSIVTRFLNGGRLVKLYTRADDDAAKTWDWGVVVNFTTKAGTDSLSPDPDTIVHVLLNCLNTTTSTSGADGNATELPSPAPLGTMGVTSSTNCEMKICPVPLEMLDSLSSLRVYIPKDLRTLDSRQSVGKSVREVMRRFPQGVPLLDPVEDMDIKDEQFTRVVEKIKEAEAKLAESPFHNAKDKDTRFALYNLKMETETKMRELERKIKESKSLVLRDDLRRRRRVLRRLEFVGKDGVIQRKGRTACEVSTCDELLVTEMIFNGQFNDLTVNETVALLSCMINTEKAKEGQKPPAAQNLEAPVRQMRETARRIAKIVQDAKMTIDVDEYAESFNTSLVDVTIAWCEGARFSQICKMTDAFEGSIIRCLRRLEELLRQLTVAAHTIGDAELEKKFEEGCKKIKRDIVFAASLYL
ncbi:TPA: hypothetical protein N0F65_010757 [Lagenidium giganteum]|uniref:Uncharacterized protein n=1 Tax=Lagenidium giganteum TaxID=4803 RepID=A0AAV2YQM7_9STRA|nr:TPA: hypothetical protein N0F65_010757 [Lagenidium giganteum]